MLRYPYSPIPPTEQLTLQGFTVGESVSLVDAQGKTLRNIPINSTTTTPLALDELAQGTYWIKSSTGTYRFVKK